MASDEALREMEKRMVDDHHRIEAAVEKVRCLCQAILGRLDAQSKTDSLSSFNIYWKLGTVAAAALAAFLGLRGG